MSVGLPTKPLSQIPKGKRLGFGYEKKSSESPSVESARAGFAAKSAKPTNDNSPPIHRWGSGT
jgi:hypothetical protein